MGGPQWGSVGRYHRTRGRDVQLLRVVLLCVENEGVKNVHNKALPAYTVNVRGINLEFEVHVYFCQG